MLLFCLIIICVYAAAYMPIGEPKLRTFIDKTYQFSLSNTESAKISIGRVLSDTLTVIGDQISCQIERQSPHQEQLSITSYGKGNGSMPVSTIYLPGKKNLITIDDQFRIRVYNISAHRIRQHDKAYSLQVGRTERGSPVLVSVEEDQYIYMLESKYSIHFFSDFLKSSVTRLTIRMPKLITGAVSAKNYIFVSSERGIYRYYRQHNMNLKLVDSNVNLTEPFKAVDLKLDMSRCLLYVLAENYFIYVFNVTNCSSGPIGWELFDSINISNITRKNRQLKVEDQIILVMFEHVNRHVIAYLNYNQHSQTFVFVRYYKFNYLLTDMELSDSQLIAMSKGSITTYNVGIHPKMIQDIKNTSHHSHILKGIAVQNRLFVGIALKNITLFKLSTTQYSWLVCRVLSGIMHEVVYTANMTRCRFENRKFNHPIDEYCHYKKTIYFYPLVDRNGLATLQELMIAVCLLMLFVVCMMVVALIYKRFRIKRMKLMDYTDIIITVPEAPDLVALPSDTNRMQVQTENRLVWKPPITNN